MGVAAERLGDLRAGAEAAHRRMLASAAMLSDEDCRSPSLLPGWTRGHVLTHWARNADGQVRMLAAAMRGEVAEQYPGGDERRAADIAAGAARPAAEILADAAAAVERVEDMWRRMPGAAWSQPTAARVGVRPAWKSVWARWRETDIHHVDLDAGCLPRHWPPELVDLLLPRVLPTAAGRLAEGVALRLETTDRGFPAADVGPLASGAPVVVRGPAAAVLGYLLGRPAAVRTDLRVSRAGDPVKLPELRPWA